MKKKDIKKILDILPRSKKFERGLDVLKKEKRVYFGEVSGLAKVLIGIFVRDNLGKKVVFITEEKEEMATLFLASGFEICSEKKEVGEFLFGEKDFGVFSCEAIKKNASKFFSIPR